MFPAENVMCSFPARAPHSLGFGNEGNTESHADPFWATFERNSSLDKLLCGVP